MSNYATKADSKNAAGGDTSDFANKSDLTNSESDIDKLDIDKMKNVPSNLSNLESKVDKLDVDKLVPVAFDLSKLSDVVKNDVVKKDIYNPKMKNIEDKIPDIILNAKINEVKNKISNNAKLVNNDSLNDKINKFKYEISSITNLATNTALTAI